MKISTTSGVWALHQRGYDYVPHDSTPSAPCFQDDWKRWKSMEEMLDHYRPMYWIGEDDLSALRQGWATYAQETH